MPSYLKAIALIATTTLTACSNDKIQTCTNDTGFLITNISLLDGSGSAPISASVRVSESTILEIGELDACEGEMVVNGNGKVLAPGFIDTHSHADGDIFDRPDLLITTNE